MLLVAITLVVCAPGYPGNSAEAQPAMDSLARALSAAARLPVKAVYDESVEGGLQKLGAADSALLLSSLPFFLDQEKKLALAARMMAVPKDGGALQRWTLVAARQRPADLAIQSTAGYSPRFVHALSPALKDAKVIASQAVLSGLRRAANGEPLALLLDGPQGQALPTLPFAQALEPISTSEPMPVALVSTVGKRIDEKKWKAIQAAFLSLAKDAGARDALEGVRMSAFVALDREALSAARSAYERAR